MTIQDNYDGAECPICKNGNKVKEVSQQLYQCEKVPEHLFTILHMSQANA